MITREEWIVELLVDVRDAQGDDTGRAVPVRVLYHTEVDPAYGEDADGRRGIRLVEHVIDRAICLDPSLTESERKQVEADAEAMFRCTASRGERV
jgi:hypothetical protein